VEKSRSKQGGSYLLLDVDCVWATVISTETVSIALSIQSIEQHGSDGTERDEKHKELYPCITPLTEPTHEAPGRSSCKSQREDGSTEQVRVIWVWYRFADTEQ